MWIFYCKLQKSKTNFLLIFKNEDLAFRLSKRLGLNFSLLNIYPFLLHFSFFLWLIVIFCNFSSISEKMKIKTLVLSEKWKRLKKKKKKKNTFFTSRPELHDYHTRYKDHYHQTKNAKTFSDHSITTYGPILWNSLDNNVRKSNSIKRLKNPYKTNFMCLYK